MMIQLQNMLTMRLALVLGGLSLPSMKREEGQTLVEYALILVAIAVVVAGVVAILGNKITDVFNQISDSI
jgi:pilus assembly protein Flp/PilA